MPPRRTATKQKTPSTEAEQPKTKPPVYVKGTKCTGSGKSWDNGAKCPECGIKADNMVVQARRGDGSLYPRVPIHDVQPQSQPQPNGTAPTSRKTVTARNELAKPPARKVAASSTRTRALKSVPEPKPTTKAMAEAAKTGTTKLKAAIRTRQSKDPLTKEFTQTIKDYLVWLEKQTGPFKDMDPQRLAGLAITMYGRYQVSPERVAARNGKVH